MMGKLRYGIRHFQIFFGESIYRRGLHNHRFAAGIISHVNLHIVFSNLRFSKCSLFRFAMSHLSIIMDNIIDLRSHFTIFSETVEVTSGGLQKSAKFVAC